MPTNSGKSDMIALSSYFNYIFDELNNEKFDLVYTKLGDTKNKYFKNGKGCL